MPGLILTPSILTLKLIREECTRLTTIGSLFIEKTHECYTLEDCDRYLEKYPILEDLLKHKVKHETAIPRGTYEIALTFSDRFQKIMPLLLNVPGFHGIRIHPGNTSADTSGCILVGDRKLKDKVTASNVAFGRVFEKLKVALNQGKKIVIEIV